jgi:hypothetical protein
VGFEAFIVVMFHAKVFWIVTSYSVGVEYHPEDGGSMNL